MELEKKIVAAKIKKQKDIIDDMERILSNLKKLGIALRTQTEYEAKSKRLEELYEEAVDNEKVPQQQADKGCEYFVKQKFQELLNTNDACAKYLSEKRLHYEKDDRKQDEDDGRSRDDGHEVSSSSDESIESSRCRRKKKQEKKLISLFIKSLQDNTKELMQDDRESSMSLPAIEIPVFNGDYRKFREFIETFTEIIDKTSAPNIEKLILLRTKLTGEALRTIDHLVLVGENYPKAWALLKERYINERKLIDIEMKILLDLPVTTPRSSEAVRSMINTIREVMANLELYGLDPLQWDPLVSTVLIQKLDHHTRDMFEDTLENSRILPTTKDLEKFLLRRAETLEAINISTAQTQPTRN